MENPHLEGEHDVASRIARQTLDRREPDYTDEVRRLIDAGRIVMRRCGTDSRPRVADIVAEADLSNEGFYRHFASKDALVAAILDDGTERLLSYLAHQMAKESTGEGRVRRWVEGILSQAADEESAATTLAVLWNSAGLGHTMSASPTSTSARLATLLHEPLAELGRCGCRVRRRARGPRRRRPAQRPAVGTGETDPGRDGAAGQLLSGRLHHSEPAERTERSGRGAARRHAALQGHAAVRPAGRPEVSRVRLTCRACRSRPRRG